MSRCFKPIQITPKIKHWNGKSQKSDNERLTVPCGQCLGCRFQRAEAWTIRIIHESQQHAENAFITLTYSEENLPPNGSLCFDDVTKFFKRLRKSLKGKKISYYYCGEYGEDFSRPHYHICLFGHDFSSDRFLWRMSDSGPIYRSPSLEKLWDKGFSEIGTLEYDSARYTAGYVQKKVTGKNAESHYQKILPDGEIIQLTPEAARMSRRPAIGLKWISEYTSDVYNQDHVVLNSKILRTPAYYDKWLEKNNPLLYQKIKMTREQAMIGLSTYDQSDLTRMYETRSLLNRKERSLEGAAAPAPDSAILEYLVTNQNKFHLEKKNG